MKKITIVLVLVWMFCIHTIVAQKASEAPIPSIQVIARVNDANQVLLRWAATTSSAWIKGNKFGYMIERFTVKRDGVHLNQPEKKQLTSVPILPTPVAEWEAVIQENDQAAIMAQALYGENFEITQMQGGLAQIVNKAKEIEQRFSFALFAADMDFEVAKMAGLGFVDTDVKQNETYFYLVKSAVPETVAVITPAKILVTPSKKEALPKPIDLIAVGDDKSVLLTWEYAMFKKVFTSYFVERSEDGTHFTRLGDTPLVNLNDTPERPANRMFYIDTIPQNNKTYHYRVIGISPFGAESPASDTVTAKGVKKLEAVPHISGHTFDQTGAVMLTWDFDKKAEQEISGFELNWAAQEKGPYTTVTTDIPATERTTRYLNPAPSNYFRIKAIGKHRQHTTSLTAFVQTIDSIPPAAPTAVRGVVDTLGVVQLEWAANAEKDLLGYRIFRGNLAKEEVAQLTVSPIAATTYTDTVQLRSLNSKVYYQVVAVDQRFNMSEYSEKLALQKPDVVPPSSPVFSAYTVTTDGVSLAWINSTSEDVQSHQLYRQSTQEAAKGWQLLFRTTDTISRFTDTKAATGSAYRYAIFAEDVTGLRSAPSTPLTIRVQRNDKIKVVKGFKGFADRVGKKIDLSWKLLGAEVAEILLYKYKEDGTPVLWKQLPASIRKISDSKVHPNTTYVYQLKAIAKNGQFTEIEKITITY